MCPNFSKTKGKTPCPAKHGIGMNNKKARIKNAINKALRGYKPEKVYLFGSWARDEADDLSDVDIVVIKNTSLSFFDRLREVRRLLPFEKIGNIDVLVYTPEEFSKMKESENPFVMTVLEEGNEIYGKQKG